MAYKVVSTIINLLLTTPPQYQELMLISQLNKFFNFDHNIYLVDSAAEFNRFIPTRQREYTPQSIYFLKNGDNNFSVLDAVKEINSKNTFLIVIPESFSMGSNLSLATGILKIRQLQHNIKIGVFTSHMTSTQNIHEFFEWCWKHRILNIFAAFNSYSEKSPGLSGQHTLNIYTFNPFVTFEVLNVTDSESFDDFFLSKNCNFQQYPIQVAILENTWLLVDPGKSLNYELANEKLWRSVFHVLNASFITVPVNYNANPNQVKDQVDIFAYLYQNKEQELVSIYPMTITAHSLVTPEALPYREFAAYLLTVTSNNFFGYSLLVILAIMILLTFFRYIRIKKFLFLQCACEVLNLLMNDNGGINYQQLSRTEVLLVGPLTFAGFVIVSGILSTLQSFLTRPIIQPQIDTIEGIYKSPFPILTWDQYWASRLINSLESLSKHSDWSDKVHIAGYRELYQLITSYNTSMSFCWEEPRAKVLLEVQKRFQIRGYHISQTRTFNALDSYPVNDYFPCIDRLNEIIDWIRTAGLYERWKQEEFKEIMKDVVANRDRILGKSDESEIDKFPLPMFIVYGWCAGIIALAMEIICKHFKLPTIVKRLKSKI